MADEPEFDEHSIDDAEYRRTLELALETLNVGLVVTRMGHVLYASESHLRLMGYSLEELRALDVVTMVAEEGRPAAAQMIAERSRGEGGSRSVEVRAHHKSGKLLDLHVASTPMEGAPGTLMSIVRDVTAERANARRLERTHRMEAIGQLCSGIAHDFNNYLTAVRLLNESLATADDNERPALLAELEEVTGGAARLTRQLQTFAGGEVQRSVVLDVNIVVFEMAAMLRRLTGSHVELALNLEPGLPLTEIDAAQLQQVLVNLVVNAGQSISAEGGRVTVQTRADADDVILTVTDDGCGMTEQTRERAFEPLFTTRPALGSGMGLAIVYGIARQCGGDVEIESQLGRGTSVRVRLPVARRVGVSRRGRSTTPIQSDSSRTVLLVENVASTGGLVETGLTREGFAVHRTTVEDAEGTIGARLFDALVIDVDPPGEPADALRSFRAKNPTATVVFLSKPPPLDEADWDSGRVRVVPKPFSVGELVEALRRKGS